MVMDMITVDKAKKIADSKGLRPGRVKGTEGVQFTYATGRKRNNRLEIIDWEEFETTLNKRRLAVFESGGWMKIMKKGKQAPAKTAKAKTGKKKRKR